MDYSEVTLVELSKSLLGGKEAKAAALALKRSSKEYVAAGKRADRWKQSSLTSSVLSAENPTKWGTGAFGGVKRNAKLRGDTGIARKLADSSNEQGRATMRFREAARASQKAKFINSDRRAAAIAGGGVTGVGAVVAGGVAANRKYEVKRKKTG